MTDYNLLKTALQSMPTDHKFVVEGLHIDSANPVSLVEVAAIIAANIRCRIDSANKVTGKLSNPGAYIAVLSFADKIGMTIKLLKWGELQARGLLSPTVVEGWEAAGDAVSRFGLSGGAKNHLFFLILADSFGRKKQDWVLRTSQALLNMEQGYKQFKAIPAASAVFRDEFEYPQADKTPAAEKTTTRANLADDM